MTSIQQIFTAYKEFLQRRYERERFALIDEFGDNESGHETIHDQYIDVCRELWGDDWKEFPETWSLDDHNNRKNDLKDRMKELEEEHKQLEARWEANENRKPIM